MLLETLLGILLKHTAGYSAGLPLYAAVTGTQSTVQPVSAKGPGELKLSAHPEPQLSNPGALDFTSSSTLAAARREPLVRGSL